MATLAKLKRERGLIKTQLTKHSNYIEKINPLNLNDKVVMELTVKLQRIEPLYDKFEETQSQIEELTMPSATLVDINTDSAGEDDLNDNETINDAERSDFEEKYYHLVSSMKLLIENYKKHQQVSTINPIMQVPSVHSFESTTPSANQMLQQVKLPPISLPSFGGQYDDWVEFRDCFGALINDNPTLSDIQKFYYLRLSLKKDAVQIIESLSTSAANYAIAWQMLNDRFEQKSLIIHSHVSAIFDHPSINNESHVELRKLYDTITKHLRALKTLGEQTQHWDTLIIYLMASKMDNKTRREWELFKKQNEVPTMTDIDNFFKERCSMLEKLTSNKPVDKRERSVFKTKTQSFVSNVSSEGNNNRKDQTKIVCYLCNKNHTIYQCGAFLNLTPSDRIARVKDLQLCYNCLRPNHSTKNCTSSNCKQCGKRHNSLLHLENFTKPKKESETYNSKPIVTFPDDSGTALHSSNEFDQSSISQVLLSTATVLIEDSFGKQHKCRALLDNGSQNNFVTTAFGKKLNLPVKNTKTVVTGINQASCPVNASIDLKVLSNDHKYKFSISCLVLDKITNNLPSNFFSKSINAIPANLPLADPQYNEPRPVDLLLGSSIFWKVLCNKQIPINNTDLTMQKTQLGWILVGSLVSPRVPQFPQQISSSCCTAINCDQNLTNAIEKFWNIETLPERKTDMSIAELYCESHFKDNLARAANGQFIVKMPLKSNITLLGNSKELAKNRFLSLERRLLKIPRLQEEYVKFMNEYKQLGHMSRVNNEISQAQGEGKSYYIPHHAVIRESSTTTKVRVVFDASMKTETGVSLNDTQYVGPTIQNDLVSILLRFRMHTFVITADVSKMYRMILIHPEQRSLQQIFWRNNPNEPLQCYQLNTVTYGMASAPFLAIRCIHQLAIDHEKSFPTASSVITNDFYVDDLITGHDSKAELIQLQQNVSRILSSASFELRKWLSNDPEILKQIKVKEQVQSGILNLGDNTTNKTLGVLWNANQDTIQFSSLVPPQNITVTKRTVLSTIAQVFDPLGLLGPLITLAKLIMQTLWAARLTWDEPLPLELYNTWAQFKRELSNLREIQVPRLVKVRNSNQIEIHVFADASERAYGACVYVRSKGIPNQCTCNLLISKARVAPLKSITLPRLELCAAVLAVQLANKVTNSIDNQVMNVYFWSDSTITLCWIKGEPTQWKTFVANRVSEIQRLSKADSWHYIPSKENPADQLSRGAKVQEIKNSRLWFHGPIWLSDPNYEVTSPELNVANVNAPEKRKPKSIALLITDDQIENSIFNRVTFASSPLRPFHV